MDPNLQQYGKIFVIIGAVIILAGLVMLFGGKIPFIGKLPGDIYIRKENYTVYIPIATSILISLILSVIAYFLRK